MPLARPISLGGLILVTALVPVRADIFRGVAAFERGDFAAAMAELKPLAAAGEMEAQYYVARMYHQGHVEQDLEEAAQWYRKAADGGHAGAQNNLGVLYERGLGVPASEAEAARWYRRAAEQSLIVAQANLASLYEEGRGVDADPLEALRWYRRAAEAGHVRAQYRLAVLYDEGRTGVADPDKAAHWYRAAAEQDHAPSQLALARMFEEGRGVEQSSAKANKWRRRAGAQGLNEPPAEDRGLVADNATTRGTVASAPDPEAAAAGPPQQEERPPVERTPEALAAESQSAASPSATEPAPEPPSSLPATEASSSFDLSDLRQRADEDDPEACYRLGRRYATGDGVPESRVEAGRWYLAAAESGHDLAAYLLGFQYLRGHGITEQRDLVQAHFWFSVAAERGVSDAETWRESVTKKMTRKEREQADALYRDLPR